MHVQWLLVALLRLIVLVTRPLPYRARISLLAGILGSVVRNIPVARKRIKNNIALVKFDHAPKTASEFERDVIANFAQNLAEFYNIKSFSERTARFHLCGDGLKSFEKIIADNKPGIVVSGHLGQWEAIRAWLRSLDRETGVIYKENSNRFYEELIKETYSFNGPAYHTGVRGMAGFVRLLKAGNIVALLHDQRIYDAKEFPFMGVPARTSTATAALAIKYDVPIIPIYAIRRDNGYDYDIIVEPALERSDEKTMTQAMNDNLEKFVRRYPTQWYWFHQRWKKRGIN